MNFIYRKTRSVLYLLINLVLLIFLFHFNKKANIKLDEDIRAEQLERETVKLNPSSNVTGNSSQFIKKMKKLF